MSISIAEIVRNIHKHIQQGQNEMIIWKPSSEIENILFLGIAEMLKEMYEFIEIDYKEKTIIFIIT